MLECILIVLSVSELKTAVKKCKPKASTYIYTALLDVLEFCCCDFRIGISMNFQLATITDRLLILVLWHNKGYLQLCKISDQRD